MRQTRGAPPLSAMRGKAQPWDDHVRIRERTLPPYDALTDPNCDWTRSEKFHERMYSTLSSSSSHPGLHSSASTSWMPLEMPALESAALEAIDTRELHLSRLHALLLEGISHDAQPAVQAAQLAALRTAAADELHALRLAGVAVVEAIVRWRRRRRRKLEPFVWRSHNYLLKMLLDIFFLGVAETIAETASDPFLLACFQEPAKRASKSPKGAAPGAASPTRTNARLRQLAVLHLFSPGRRHTKHEIVRMWAAERILEAERAEIGAAFEPIAPVLQPTDLQLREHASLILFGRGESPELAALSPPNPAFRPPSRVERPPDPAYKPPPFRHTASVRTATAEAISGGYPSAAPPAPVPQQTMIGVGSVGGYTPPALPRPISRSLRGLPPHPRPAAKSVARQPKDTFPGVHSNPIVPRIDPMARPTSVALGDARPVVDRTVTMRPSSGHGSLALAASASAEAIGFFTPAAMSDGDGHQPSAPRGADKAVVKVSA